MSVSFKKVAKGGMQSVYVGLPAFNVNGDVMDDGVSDAIVEAFDVKPKDVAVTEFNDKFYVFVDSFAMNFAASNQVVARAKEISKSYDQSLAHLTKLIRKSDKTYTALHQIRSEVQALEEEQDSLRSRLAELESQNAARKEAAKHVEESFNQLVKSLDGGKSQP